MAELLRVNGLSTCVKKDGKNYKILNNISFSINEGEILGLAGESGCGKSITALSISKLLPQGVEVTEGEVIFNDRNLILLDEKEMTSVRGNGISVIFQDVRNSLNPLMKVGGQITETLELGGGRDKDANKTAALEMLSSLGFNNPQKILDAYPHQLSGGMCQRVMTAIAVIRRPKLLLADEPSASLDEESQEKCLSLLKEMNSGGKMSLLVISHDLLIIRQFCSRFIIMYAGKIVEEGHSGALFSPLHPYTKALVNAIPNKEKRGKKLESIPGKIPSIEDQLQGCPFAPRCARAQAICKKSFPPPTETDKGKVYCYYPCTGAQNE
jgi:peptide/nickel transport system ATP-binding protein